MDQDAARTGRRSRVSRARPFVGVPHIRPRVPKLPRFLTRDQTYA